MSDDGLPSDDQVRRIEQGVMGRIDARRAMRNRVIGSVTAVVLVGGGFGLITGVVRSGGTSMSSGSGADSAASAMVVVRCALDAGSDTGAARSVRVPEDALPQSALAACSGQAVEYQSGDGATPVPAARGNLSTDSPSSVPTSTAPSTPPSTLPKAVLCTAADGSLVVLSLSGSASATCVRAGMEPYQR